MSPLNFTHILTQAVDELSESESYKGLFHQHKDGEPLPSAKVLYEIIELSRAILFPGYYGNSTINSRTINYHIGVNIEKLFDLLTEQILAGLCFGTSIEGRCNACSDSKREEAARLAAKFISKLPVMRRVLATDVEAAYNGDPAAESYGEVIFCYPAIKAISNYRIAHELLELGVPLIPRIITEAVHIATTGRPGPVVIDLPKDVSALETDFVYSSEIDLPSYQPTVEPNDMQIKKILKQLSKAKKPVLLAGGGISYAEAAAELNEFGF